MIINVSWFLKNRLFVCLSVTLLDTRTVPGELKWAASPSERGVSGCLSFTEDNLFCLWKSLLLACFAHARTHAEKESSHRSSDALLFTKPKVLIWACRRVWLSMRHIPAWWWVSFLKGFLLALHLPAQNLETFILYNSRCTIIFLLVFFLLAPEIFAVAFWSESCTSFTPQQLLVNLTGIPLLSPLSFSRMLLDWQGPAQHALSFWLQAPPITTLCTHSHSQNAASLHVATGQVQIFFFFFLFSSDSCGLGLIWQRLPQELPSGGEVGHPSIHLT